jgi:hypothetical protein
MNFTAMSTLAFADVPPTLRASATTLSAMAQQAGSTVGVAAAAVALSLFQALRSGATLAQSDFRNALFVAAALMTLVVLASLRLPLNAGAELARRSR